MKIAELKQILEKEKYNPHSYSLNGIKPYECYCLEESYGTFYVFYYERGNRLDERAFKSEDEACEYLYDLLKNDETTRANGANDAVR